MRKVSITLSLLLALIVLSVPVFAENDIPTTYIQLKPTTLNKVDEKHVQFGYYPQTEVVANESQCGTSGQDWGTSEDYYLDANLYSSLQSAQWDSNGDTEIGGSRYHRITRSDTYNTYASDGYYSWANDSEYHYFKYEPLKWRILQISDTDAFLFSDTIIDYRPFWNGTVGSDTVTYWDSSDLRAWLNNSFLNIAFTELEKLVVKTTQNRDPYDDTNNPLVSEDKVFLLSESAASKSSYGFASMSPATDKARALKASTYAKAMGIYVYPYDYNSQLGNSTWALITRSYNGGKNHYMSAGPGGSISGGNLGEGLSAGACFGIAPAMHISLKSKDPIITSNVYKSMSLSESQYFYDGSEKCPQITIEGLSEGTDYVVTYSNNIEAGTATVTAEGIGRYEGKITNTYSIKKHQLSENTITLSETSFYYDGQAKEPLVSIGDLTQDVDYEVAYENNIQSGTATVTATGIGMYTGELSATFTINKTLLSNIGITLSEDFYYYDGTEKCPEVIVGELKEGEDFTVKYNNNISPGTATAKATGIGNYTGSVSATFTIDKVDISNYEATLSEDRLQYDGEEKCPTVTVDSLIEGTDYDVSYFNNVNAGKATVTIVGKGRYKGTITKQFTIWKEFYSLFVDDNEEELYAEGDTVIIKNNKETEYRTFAAWKVVSGTLPLSSDELKENPLTFKMPAVDIKIAATFNGTTLQEDIANEDERYNAILNKEASLRSNIESYSNAINQVMNRYGESILQSVSYYESQFNSTHETLVQKQEELAREQANTNGGSPTTIARLKQEIAELNQECIMYTDLKQAAEWQKQVNSLQKELNKINLSNERIKHENNIETICENHYVTDVSVPEIEYILFDKDEYEYTGKAIHPIITVIDINGNTLGSESYDLVFPDDCTSVGDHVVTINLKGYYAGTKNKSFVIAQHSYGDWVITKEPTCIEEGSKEKTCSDCGKIVVEKIEQLGHDWNSEYTTDKEATCEAEGLESIHCKRCGESKDIRPIAILDHTYTDWTITKEASCTETGLKERTCISCGNKEEIVIPITHEYGNPVVVKEATCVDPGIMETKCSICNNVITEEIPALGHKWNTTYTVDVAASYTAVGSKSIHCLQCNESKSGTSVKIPQLEKVDLPAISIKKPAAAKKSATIKWKKLSKANKKKVSTIQIQYGLDKTFKTGVKTITAKNTAASKKITKLISKKTYYIRIRAYKKVSGVTHVSKWSAVKSVKAK